MFDNDTPAEAKPRGLRASVHAFARFVFGLAGSMLLCGAALYAFNVPPDLPGWRYAAGFALLAAAALVYCHFIED